MNPALAAKGIPVELEGVVAYSDPEWNLLFVYDPTGTIFIQWHEKKTRYPLGTMVRVTGVTGVQYGGPIIIPAKITAIGHRKPPPAPRRTLAELNALDGDGQLIETQGVLQPFDFATNRLWFRIFDGSVMSWVVLPESNSAAKDMLAGATVRVKGVSGRHTDLAGKFDGAQIYVNRIEDIQVIKPAAANNSVRRQAPFQLRSIRELQSFSNDKSKQGLPIEFEGVVSYSDPE